MLSANFIKEICLMRFAIICLLILSTQVFATDSIKQNSVADFTQGMTQQTGFFDFYYQIETDKVFLKIDKLDQPFLFQSSMPQGIGSNDIGLDRGQLGDTRLVKFERFGNKVLLKQLNTQ